jgi:hypothetical protein
LVHVHRRAGDQPTHGGRSIIQLAIVVGGVIAVGLLVAAHPVIGVALIVGVILLVLLFGRPPGSAGSDQDDDEVR